LGPNVLAWHNRPRIRRKRLATATSKVAGERHSGFGALWINQFIDLRHLGGAGRDVYVERTGSWIGLLNGTTSRRDALAMLLLFGLGAETTTIGN